MSQSTLCLTSIRKHSILYNSALKDLQALDEVGTPIDFAQLQEFLRFHQALLSPLFQLHTTLRAKVLGVAYWDRLTANRAALTAEQHTAVNNFISKVLWHQLYITYMLHDVEEVIITLVVSPASRYGLHSL